jgi:hypothetical protein
MDHTPAMRPAAGSGTGPVGTAAPGTRGGPCPPSGGNAGVSRRKRHGTPGETRVTCRAETPGPPGAETRGSPAANARKPSGKRVAWRVNAADHRPPDGNAAGQRPSSGKRRWLAELAAERTPGDGRGVGVRIAPSFRRTRPWGRAGRAAPRPIWPGWPGRPGSPFPNHKF